MNLNSYGKLSTLFYDLDKPDPPPDAFRYYLHHARTAHNDILEPMCGSGRFLIPLMQRGMRVIGVDASPHMLNACRRRANDLGFIPELYEQFLHELDLPGKFQMVMIPAGSFCLMINPLEASTSLKKIYHHLVQGGTLILEIEQLIPPAGNRQEEDGSQPRSITCPDGTRIRMLSSGKMNPDGQIYRGINRYDLIRDGQILETEHEKFNLRYYRPQSFIRLLTAAGFRDIHHHSAYDPNMPVESSESLVFIAKRP